jgi:hypothetical protein
MQQQPMHEGDPRQLSVMGCHDIHGQEFQQGEPPVVGQGVLENHGGKVPFQVADVHRVQHLE